MRLSYADSGGEEKVEDRESGGQVSSGQEMGSAGRVHRRRVVPGDVVAGLAVIVGGGRVGFGVDRSVIPVGIRCDRCRVSHLPAKVIAKRDSGAEGQGDGIVRLRCPGCSAVSEIAVDASSAHGDLLDVLGVEWRDDGSVEANAG